MFYVEQIRIRNGLVISGLIVVGVILFTAAFTALCRKCATADASNLTLTLSVIGWAASLGAAIFASVFGGSLSYENDDHLPLAWTKPINRTAQALGIMALDLVAVAAVFVLLYAAAWVMTWLISGRAVPIAFDADNLIKTARFAAFPLAWFGLTQALTSGFRGGRCGMIIGPMWPVAEGLFALTLLRLSAPWSTILKVLNLANPINYVPFWQIDEQVVHKYAFGYGPALDLIALALIACAGIAVATIRWRWVED
jgi:hypothetical protein